MHQFLLCTALLGLVYYNLIISMFVTGFFLFPAIILQNCGNYD